MGQSISSQIESDFAQLSVPEQLRLIERLVHRVQQNALFVGEGMDALLPAMAADPEILSEIRDIEREFACAEADGLETA